MSTERPYKEQYDKYESHVHMFLTMADIADGHQHAIVGTTGPEIKKGQTHVHCIRIRTSYDDGHWHEVDIMTGPSIEISEEKHTHCMGGETSCNNGHLHEFLTVTDASPDDMMCQYREPSPS